MPAFLRCFPADFATVLATVLASGPPPAATTSPTATRSLPQHSLLARPTAAPHKHVNAARNVLANPETHAMTCRREREGRGPEAPTQHPPATIITLARFFHPVAVAKPRPLPYSGRVLLKFVTRLEDSFYSGTARVLRRSGWRPEVLGFGGLGTTDGARVIARVLMAPTPFEEKFEAWVKTSGMPTLQEISEAMDRAHVPAAELFKDAIGTDEADPQVPTSSTARGERGWRQFLDAQIPYHPVLVQLGDARKVVRADRGGYVDVPLRGHGLKPGWHEASVQALDSVAFERGEKRVRASRPASVPVRIVARFETHGLVSDVDDTVMISWLPRPLVAAKNAFISYVSSRQAVPGMARFLQTVAVALGVSSAQAKSASARGELTAADQGADWVQLRSVPVVYLSTGAWNVAPGLRRFLARGAFPFGLPLMTDWGPSQTGWFRSGREHKRSQLRLLARFFPWVKWVLVGDDGQHDPTIYAEFAREFPNQVAAICIRTLTPAEQVLSHGGPTPQERLGEVFADVPPSVPIFIGEDGHALLRSVRSHGLL